MEEDDEFGGDEYGGGGGENGGGGGGEYGGGGGEYGGGGGGEYGGGGSELGGGRDEFGRGGGGEFGGDEYDGAAAPPPPPEPPLHLHPSELSPPRSESPPPPSEPALPLAGLAIGDDYGGGDQLNGDDYYGGAAPPPPPEYGGDEYGNGAGVVDYGAAAPLPPPPAARDEYLEPPSPMDPHCASMGGQSHASIGSIGEDIDVNSQGLVEETLERLNRVRGVLGVLILDGAGTVIRTTMEDKAVAKYSSPYATGGSNPGLSSPLVRLAKA